VQTKLTITVLLVIAGLAVAGIASAKTPAVYKNCTNLNKKYPHGIGRAKARDHSTTGRRVTNFTRSDRLYRIAISYNRGLDRDHDGIACETA
jgi:orotate phosphoribosyltransferase